MPKTVEEIKNEITRLVKSQGNQGAISLGDVLDDITELAGEGGGGGTTLPTVYLKNPADAGDTITVDTTEDTKAIYDAAVANGVVNFNVSFKVDEVGGSMTGVIISLPAIARAVYLEGGVFATFLSASGASATKITTSVLELDFDSDGSVDAINTAYQYVIPQ